MFRRKRKSADFSAEIQAHIGLEADRLRETGMSESDVPAAARRAFGNLTAAEEGFYERTRPLWWDQLGCDLRLAFRSLKRERVFAAFAILLIGLGTGITTTMFALFDAIALRKLAVPSPDSLYHIVTWKDGAEASLRYGMFERLRASLDVMDSIFATTGTVLPVTYDRQTRMVSIQYSAGDYYRTMGARPVFGRLLTPADDGPVAVISNAYWRRLGADPGIIGKTIHAGPIDLTIVGVVPDAAHEVIRFNISHVMVPLGIGMILEGVPAQRVYRYNVDATARLKPGVTPVQLQQRLDALWPRLLEETIPPGQSLEEWTRLAGAKTRLLPGNRGRLWTMGELPRVTLVLLILAGLVSLTMCSNLAGLLLSRGLGRRKEYAVRIALGAGRWRLVRLALSEVLVLSLLGGAAALLLAQWLTGLCGRLLSTNSWLDYGVKVDGGVAAFALLLSVLTAMVAQILPALRLSRVDLRSAMGQEGRTVSARLGSRRVMLVLQMAASLVLVIGSLLFIRTVQSLLRVDLGFDARNVLAVRLTGRAPWSEVSPAFFQELVQRVRQLPSVTAAGLADRVPMEMTSERSDPIAAIGGFPGEVPSDHGCVWPGFLNALRIPVLSGRDFRDAENGAVVLTSELARSLFPQGEPLGRFVRTGNAPKPETYQVIGVIGDVRFRTPRQQHANMFFVPCRQAWTPPQTRYAMTLGIRVAGSTADVEAGVRREIEAMGRQGIIDAIPLEQVVSKSTRNESMLTAAAGVFGACTLLLTCAGIYALIDLSARARRREIGIRSALGADRRRILQLLLSEAAQVIALGAGAGIAASFVMGRVYRAWLYGVADSEPMLVAIAMITVSLFAICAALAPAWKAATRPPAEVMSPDV